MSEPSESVVPPELLEIMQCPACAGGLRPRTEPPALICVECGLVYPVRDGIPVMLVEEATPSEEA